MIQDDIRKKMDEISTRRRRNYSGLLRQLNLHIGQDQLLCALWEKNGLTQTQLSEQLNCEPPTVANMVRTMENHGLIYRKRDPSDARVNRVYVTPQGLQLKEPIKKIWKQEQEKLLEGLSHEELLVFQKLLHKMAKNIS